MNLTELTMFGLPKFSNWRELAAAVILVKDAWNKKDFTAFSKAVEALSKVFGWQRPSKELLEMVDAARKGEWTSVAENGAELVLEIIAIIKGQVSSTMISLLSTVQDENFDEVIFLLGCTDVVVATSEQPSDAQAIPIPVIIGLVQLFLEWRKFKKSK